LKDEILVLRKTAALARQSGLDRAVARLFPHPQEFGVLDSNLNFDRPIRLTRSNRQDEVHVRLPLEHDPESPHRTISIPELVMDASVTKFKRTTRKTSNYEDFR
jgi:hypothetical protein